ncbi:MAG: 3-hydroxyacyl-CoA dehydrogenase NAD-binding domain-containing protein [bacterium]
MQTGPIKAIAVVGAGTMGCQISLDCALAGYEVKVFDADPKALETMPGRWRIWSEWQVEKGFASAQQADRALARIRRTPDPEEAGRSADVLIEAVFEHLDTKRKVFAQFEEICPERTLLVTNTSTLIPREMETGIRRKDKFSAFHFCWPKTIIEIMRGSATSDETVARLEQLARSLGYLPIRIRREFPGYVHAALFAAWAMTGVQLAALGIASLADIDRAWMRGDEAPMGPLAALDAVGLDLVMMILKQMQAIGVPGFDYQTMASFLQPYLDRGDLGRKTGKGFYSYPKPEFQDPGFLR